jgi:hypothetical protein
MSADPGSLTVGEFLKFRSLILFRYYSIHLLRTKAKHDLIDDVAA